MYVCMCIYVMIVCVCVRARVRVWMCMHAHACVYSVDLCAQGEYSKTNHCVKHVSKSLFVCLFLFQLYSYYSVNWGRDGGFCLFVCFFPVKYLWFDLTDGFKENPKWYIRYIKRQVF